MKVSGAKRMRLKRAREWVYLTHFLATNGFSPQKIISGADDGKEPDFTCMIDGKLVGIELTTLPRLRDRMGSEYLWLKRWYWRLRAFFKPNRYPLKPKQLRRLVRLQTRKNLLQQPLPAKQKQAIRLLKQKITSGEGRSKLGQYKTKASKKQNKSRQTINTILDFSAKKAQIEAVYKSSHADRLNKPISYIVQSDIDAVMEKKAHKVEGYNRRRKLDELWLLIHTDFKQPSEVLYFPNRTINHSSDYDKVWLTCYPLVHAYPVLQKLQTNQTAQDSSLEEVSSKKINLIKDSQAA